VGAETIAIFGSTGSIGQSTIDVALRNPDRYRIHALCANRNVELLLEQCLAVKPQVAAMADPEAARELATQLRAASSNTTVNLHESAPEQIAASPEVDVVMAAIVGFAGLSSTLTAAQNGKRILLANKEAMVVAGPILNKAARDGGATIVPVDSEHNAIFQCLPANTARLRSDLCSGDDVCGLLLTASGGPFREWSAERMADATVAEAINHPNWSMGSKISVDSATMMNKGLEVIEACYLFGVDESFIEVLVHPQSVVHSMVRYCDGSVLAQLGRSDMRTPIAHALAWPDRIDAGVEPLDFGDLAGLVFEAPDEQRFPCLALAREALRSGHRATGVLNAANEVAVEYFLQERLGFTDIARVNAQALADFPAETVSTLDDIYRLDRGVRQYCRDYIENGLSPVGLN